MWEFIYLVYMHSKSMYPVQGSLVMDGGMIVIVQAPISQDSLIPWPFTKSEGLVYTVCACSKICNLVRFSYSLYSDGRPACF